MNPEPLLQSLRDIPPIQRRGIDTQARVILASTELAAGHRVVVTGEAVPAVPGGVTLDAGADRYDYWASRAIVLNKTGGAAAVTLEGTRDDRETSLRFSLPAGAVSRSLEAFDSITAVTSDAAVTIDLQAGNVIATGARWVSSAAGGTLTSRMTGERFLLQETLAAGERRAGAFEEISAAPADALLEW